MSGGSLSPNVGETNCNNTDGLATLSDLHSHPQECPHDTDGHKEFLPLMGLSVNQLPPELQDEELLRMIFAIADLIIKIVIGHQSEGAEEEAGAEEGNPCQSNRGAPGSGIICSVKKQDNGELCQCLRCQDSGAPRNVWAKVEVVTASSVIPDDSLATRIEAKLDFGNDSSGPSHYSLKGFKVIERQGENSFTVMECVTCDPVLIDILEKCTLTFETLRPNVYRKYRDSYRDLQRNILMVSHPHSASKHVSFGCLKVIHYSSAWSKIVHTAPACSGCEGAFVYFVGCSGGVWPYPHVQVRRLASGSSSTSYGMIAKKL